MHLLHSSEVSLEGQESGPNNIHTRSFPFSRIPDRPVGIVKTLHQCWQVLVALLKSLLISGLQHHLASVPSDHHHNICNLRDEIWLHNTLCVKLIKLPFRFRRPDIVSRGAWSVVEHSVTLRNGGDDHKYCRRRHRRHLACRLNCGWLHNVSDTEIRYQSKA